MRLAVCCCDEPNVIDDICGTIRVLGAVNACVLFTGDFWCNNSNNAWPVWAPKSSLAKELLPALFRASLRMSLAVGSVEASDCTPECCEEGKGTCLSPAASICSWSGCVGSDCFSDTVDDVNVTEVGGDCKTGDPACWVIGGGERCAASTAGFMNGTEEGD